MSAIPTERCPDCVNGRRPTQESGATLDDLRAELAARLAANDDAAAALRAERRRNRLAAEDAR